jgi:hypothetical protein
MLLNLEPAESDYYLGSMTNSRIRNELIITMAIKEHRSFNFVLGSLTIGKLASAGPPDGIARASQCIAWNGKVFSIILSCH